MNINLTEGEIILLRQAVRTMPANTEFSTLYAPEIISVDNKLGDALVIYFDARAIAKQTQSKDQQ